VAETVYEVALCTVVGVPEITQVVPSIESPFGRAGFVVQEVIGDPLLVRVVGMTLMALPKVPLFPTAPE
jgi:hypothetical protein